MPSWRTRRRPRGARRFGAAGVQTRRSRRGIAHQHARSDRRRARRRSHRRGLVVVLAGLRRAGRRSIASARSSRRCCCRVDGYQYGGKCFDCRAKLDEIVQRSAERARDRDRDDDRASSRRREGRRRRHARCRWDDSWLGRRRRRADLRAAAVRSPALHPVLVGHDRRAEVHRPRRRRHAAPASQGTSAPLRHPPRRSRLLFHDAAAG